MASSLISQGSSILSAWRRRLWQARLEGSLFNEDGFLKGMCRALKMLWELGDVRMHVVVAAVVDNKTQGP